MCCWGQSDIQSDCNQLHRFVSVSIYMKIFSNKAQCKAICPKPYYYSPKTILFLKTSDSLQGIWSSNSGTNWCFREVWRLLSTVQVQGRRASRMLSIWESRESKILLFLCGSSDMVVAKWSIFLYYLFDQYWEAQETMNRETESSWRKRVHTGGAISSICSWMCIYKSRKCVS